MVVQVLMPAKLASHLGAVVGCGDDLCCARPAPALLGKEDGGPPARTTIAPRASPPRRPATRHPRDRPRPERHARIASVLRSKVATSPAREEVAVHARWPRALERPG